MNKIISLVIAAAVSVLLAGCSMGHMMIHEKKSPYEYEKTIATIQENAKAEGWIIPKVYDFQQSMIKHNQPDPGRITVLKLCQPEIASRMLAKDEQKYVSVMMPCSVSVYEKADGNTYVASMNMGLMSKLMGAGVGPILKDVAEQDKKILEFLEAN